MKNSKRLTSSFGHAKKSQTTATKKRPAPISIRVSDEEREALKRAAAGRSVNSYVRERLFSNTALARTRGRAPVQDYEALARVLGLLGRSDVYTSLSALVLAIEQQKLAASGDVERDIRHACASVRAIRAELVTALGLKG